MKIKHGTSLFLFVLLLFSFAKCDEDYAAMANGVLTAFQGYISNYQTFLTDLNSDLSNINNLPSSQFYYCFTGVPLDQCGARYKKEDAYSNVNSIYSALNGIPSYFAAMFLPTFVNSTAMNVYARQKIDVLGPCGREDCEFSSYMSYDSRKAAAGVPSANNVTEVYVYPQYGNSSTYKGAVRYVAVSSSQLISMVKPGVFKMGASCGCHASRGSICVVAVTENYSENSQSNPNTLPYQPNAVQCLASCLISNFKQLAADTDDRSRSTIVNQASTEETISYDIYQKLNLFKTRAGDFYSTYGASTSSAGSLAYTNDQNPIRYSRALGDALREKLLKDQCGTTTDFDITSRFTSVTLLTTVDIPYTTDFLSSAVQNSDFVNNLQACNARFIGVACALISSGSTKCKVSFASDLWIKSSYSAQTPIWTSSSTADWSSAVCSNVYCKLGTAVSGCTDTVPTSAQCSAAITSCTACQYDSSNVLSICTTCSQGTSVKSDNKCTICSNYNSSTGKCEQCSNGVLYNGVCVENCPSGYVTDSSNNCILSCPSYCAQCSLISGKNYCIKCSSPTCTLECPSTLPISHYVSLTSFQCVSACPSYGVLIPANPNPSVIIGVTFPLCLDCPSQYCTSCTLTSSLVSDITKLTVCNTCGPNGSTTLYLKDNDCVSSCGTTSYISSGTCVACPAGTQVYSNPILCENCGDRCSTGFCTTQSGNPYCTQCMTNSYIQENKCLVACTGDYVLFSQTSQSTIYQCLKTCPSILPYQTSSKECVASCPNTSYLDTSNSKCVDCPSGMKVYSNPSLCENCGDKCTVGYCTTQSGNPYCTQCMANSYIQENKCISACTGDYILHSQTSQSGVFQCLKTCTTSLPYQTSSGECVATCPITSYLDTSTSKCIACPLGMQVYSNPSLCENCGDKCNTGYCTSQSNRPLCTNCMDNAFLQDGKCIAACDSTYTLRAKTAKATVLECLKACTTALPYLTSDNECVALCPITSYLNTSTSKCIACPTGMQVYSNPSLCENCGDKCTDGYCTTQSGNPFCTKCMTNSYIQENKCITACTGDYILFSQTSVTGVMQCLKSCPSNLPYQTSSKECVATCPITSYLDTSTSKCIACPTGMQVYSNPSLCENCGDKCTDGFCTSLNNRPLCTKCMTNSYIQEGKCLASCTGDYTLFSKTSDSGIYQCLKACTTTYPLQTSSGECVAACPVTSYLDTATSKCIACPTGMQVYSNPSLCENCGDKCNTGYCTSLSNRPLCTNCMDNSFLQDGKCIAACDSAYTLRAKTSQALVTQCLKTCTTSLPYQTSSNECVASCPTTAYIDTATSKCVACPAGTQIFSNPYLCENCGDKCTDGFCTSQSNQPLCTKCMDNSYMQEGKCLSACSGDYVKFSQTSTSGIYQCLKICTTTLPYSMSTGECVASCPNTAYLDTVNSKCVNCPTGMKVYSNPSLCENCGDKCTDGYCTTQSNKPVCTQCMQNSYMQESKCLSTCSGDYVVYSQTAQSGIMQCLKTCTTALPYKTSAGECVASCPNTAFLDTANSKCVDCPSGMKVYSNPSLCENCGDKCTDGYCTTQSNQPVCTQCMQNSFIQGSKCLSACSGDYVVYSQSSQSGVMQCLKTCTTALPYQTSSKECVASCPNTAYLDTVNSKCVNCPTGMKIYSNPNLCENCGDKCTDGYCTTQSGNPYCTQCMTNSFIQENKCLSACTGDYALFSKTSQSGVMQCLKVCPTNLPYQTSDKECVASCPITSYLDTANSKCIACPAGMQVYSNPSICENCGDKCTDGFCTSQGNQPLCTKCMDNSFIQAGKCLVACTGDYIFHSKTSQSTVSQCLKICPTNMPYQTSDKECVTTCPITSYLESSASKCIACPAGMQVYSNPSLCENCGDQCEVGFCTSQNNLPLCTKCKSNSYNQEGKCLVACTGDYKYFIKTSLDTIYQCQKACPSSSPYTLLTGECVKSCAQTAYIDTSKMQCIDCNSVFAGCDRCLSIKDTSTSAITIKCQKCNSATPYFNSALKACVSSCESSETLIVTPSYGYCQKCPTECSTCTYSNNGFNCSTCKSPNVHDSTLGSCTAKCPQAKLNYNGECVSSCPSGYCAQKDTGACVVSTINGCSKCTNILTYSTCDECGTNRIRSGNLLTGYKCDTVCDPSNSNYCMSNGVCTAVTGYKDASGNCKDCPDNCSKCSLDSSGNVKCDICINKFCMNKTTKTCQLAVNSDYVVMTYVDSSTNTVSMQCKTACDSGYIPDMFNNCIQCDSSKYPQCSDVNCVSWNVVDGVPYCKSCKDKYQVNILNKNICKLIDICLLGQVTQNNKCIFCSDLISNCAECSIDSGTPKCSKCKVGFKTNSLNGCSRSSCTNSIISSDGLTCVNQCSTSQYLDSTQNKCIDCTISNCKNCFMNKGTEVCYECGKDPANSNKYLAINFSSCISSCTSPQITDSKGRCVSPPSNTATFIIVKEQDWIILDQLKKGIDVACPHILSANSCNSGYSLIKKSDGTQYCDVCSANTFYDSSSKTCKSCGDNCSECQSLTECKTCTPGTYPVSGKCYWNCPRGKYVSSGTCIKCDDACGGLNGSCFNAGPNSCDGCQFDTSTNTFVTFLSSNTCVSASNCPPATFAANNGKCMPCVSGCTKCSGPGKENCQDTSITSVDSTLCTLGHCSQCSDLFHCGQCESSYQLTSEGTCAKICDQGYYSDDNTNCKQCDDTCLTCTKAGECTKCKQKITGENYFVVSLINGQCQYQQCPVNCRLCQYNSGGSSPTCSCCQSGFKLNTLNQCNADSSIISSNSCIPGQRLVDNCCVPCRNPFTERCYSDSGNAEISIACQKGYFLSDGICVPICKPGYFADQILGWCVKCGCNCNTCTNYMNSCNNDCPTGTFSSTNDRCEHSLSSTPTITVVSSNNEIDVQFPANTSILNMIDTDLANDSIYSVNNVCGDDTFNYDWSDFLTSNINIENMISDLKSKLNENEQNELDYLIAQDYSSVSQSLISNNLLNKYYMQYEGQFEIIKLLALYRWSLYGKTTLANPFTYSNNNFYTDSSIVDDPCGLLFDLNSIFALNDPDCSFTTNSDGTLLISIITEDISKVDPNSSINFNDVIYYVKDTVKLPSPNISINVPASDVHKGMTIVISMKDTITTCEDLSIDYQNSQGLGYNTQVSIILDSIKDTSTGSLVSSNIAAIQATINALLNQLIQRSIEAKSRVIIISRSYLKDFSGKTVYFSIKFQNMVTGEVQSIPKMVSIVGSTMLQIQNQALQINRLISTPINTVRYVSCDSTSSGSSDSQLVCKGYIYVKDSTTGIFSTTQTTFDKCIIDPTKVNVGNIARIWIEATLNGSLKTLDIPFIVDKIQCSCDLSQIKASFGTSESLSFNSIKCPALYALKWTFKDQSGSTSDITFNTNTASFKITDHLTVGKTYMMNIDITNTDMNVVYGSCSHLIDVQNQLTTLNTQIRSVNAGSLQGPLELDIITYDSTNNQIYVDSVTLTLTISGSTTDLLKSTFISSYKLVDNSKLTFNPGIWKTGTTYILTAVSSLKGVTGKATKLISSVDKTLFSADFSPKIASTGDIIKITITNKSSTQCIFCAVGFFNNNMFTPYEIFSEPEQLCGNDEYRTTSIIVPTMSSVDAKNTDLAVLCIGDDTDLSIQERTSLQRYKIMINSKILKAADIVPDSEPITSEDFDRICLSILSLPDTECPNSYFNSICNQAISNKQDLIDQYSDQLQKLWKDLTNKLIYSMTKIVTCGDSPLNDSLHDIVRIILNGFCQTFAADDSICRSGNPNLDDLTCFSFSADFTNLILKVVNNIEAKMLASDNYSDLLDILDIVQSLIECASTDMISSGSGTEVHSADSSIAILKVKKLDSTFKAEVKYSSSVRRNRRFLATSNTCGVGFDKIASSLSGKENLILKVQLNKKCTQYTSKACDGSVDLTETPSCCEIVIQTSLKDFSGRTSVQVIDVTSDQNGLASLSIPLNTCTTTTKCAYYDKTKSCWATDGVSSSGSCADCKSTHFSIFSYINPSSKSTSSSSNNNPASVITSAVKDNMMMAYQNILLYICVLLDLYLFILFIKTCRNKNRKIHVASKRVEQINVKGYTRTMPVPRNEDVEEKINNIRSMFEINTANANQNANQNAIQNAHQNDNATAMNAFRIEEAKSIVPPNIERDDNEAEQSIDVIGNDNVIEAQTSKLEQSFCRSYFSTFCRKQRIVSPLVFNHPTLSFFSRGINVAFSLIQGSFLIVIGLLGMTSEFVSVLTIIAGLILSRILCVLLEVVLHKKRHKYINYIQIVLIIVLISLEGVIIFIPTQIKEDGGALVNVSIIIFLIFELIIYELVIHIFQVILARRLVKDPSKLNKMSKLSKLFLNPMVYEHINQSG